MATTAAHDPDLDQAAIDWLLSSDEPGIRLQTRRDLLGEQISWTAEDILEGQHAAALLTGQEADGGFGNHPYQKWMGAHWRLVSLVELGMPAGEARVMAALETSLDRFTSDGDPAEALKSRDRYRVHASIYANALAVATRLGKHGDQRVRNLAEWLVFWQWPDGGWNCDRHPDVDALVVL